MQVLQLKRYKIARDELTLLLNLHTFILKLYLIQLRLDLNGNLNRILI